MLVGKLYNQLINHPIIITMDDKSYDIQKVLSFDSESNYYLMNQF